MSLLGSFINDNQISIIMKKAMNKIFKKSIGIHELRRIYLLLVSFDLTVNHL